MNYTGGCHCGAVRFEIEAPEELDVNECNCSICTKSGYLHLILPRSRFRLITGEEHLTEYTFNTGQAKHLFCRICGIKSYYVPRSNPDGYSINARCLEPAPESLKISRFDGLNWELHAHSLEHLSKDI